MNIETGGAGGKNELFNGVSDWQGPEDDRPEGEEQLSVRVRPQLRQNGRVSAHWQPPGCQSDAGELPQQQQSAGQDDDLHREQQ